MFHQEFKGSKVLQSCALDIGDDAVGFIQTVKINIFSLFAIKRKKKINKNKNNCASFLFGKLGQLVSLVNN